MRLDEMLLLSKSATIQAGSAKNDGEIFREMHDTLQQHGFQQESKDDHHADYRHQNGDLVKLRHSTSKMYPESKAAGNFTLKPQMAYDKRGIPVDRPGVSTKGKSFRQLHEDSDAEGSGHEALKSTLEQFGHKPAYGPPEKAGKNATK